jgi:hypothetical protein
MSSLIVLIGSVGIVVAATWWVCHCCLAPSAVRRAVGRAHRQHLRPQGRRSPLHLLENQP